MKQIYLEAAYWESQQGKLVSYVRADIAGAQPLAAKEVVAIMLNGGLLLDDDDIPVPPAKLSAKIMPKAQYERGLAAAIKQKDRDKQKGITASDTVQEFKIRDIDGNEITIKGIGIYEALEAYFQVGQDKINIFDSTKPNQIPESLLQGSNDYTKYRFYKSDKDFYKCGDQFIPVDEKLKKEAVQETIEDKLSTPEHRVHVNVDTNTKEYELVKSPMVNCQVTIGRETKIIQCALSGINNITAELKGKPEVANHHIILKNLPSKKLRHNSTLKFDALAKDQYLLFMKDGEIKHLECSNQTSHIGYIAQQGFYCNVVYDLMCSGLSATFMLDDNRNTNDYTDVTFYTRSDISKIKLPDGNWVHVDRDVLRTDEAIIKAIEDRLNKKHSTNQNTHLKFSLSWDIDERNNTFGKIEEIAKPNPALNAFLTAAASGLITTGAAHLASTHMKLNTPTAATAILGLTVACGVYAYLSKSPESDKSIT